MSVISVRPADLGQLDNLYDLVGGMQTFQQLAAAFYQQVAHDPLLREMFPDDLQQPIQHLALFLAQRFGGPGTYSQKHGHPRLRMRHLPFRIGNAERDAWVWHMLAALDEVGIQDPARQLMQRYFEDTATFLINVPDTVPPIVQ